MSQRPDEPRRPIFGFLWPRPDPDAPVDAAYRQLRAIRITGRGPVRIALLVLASLAVTMAGASAVLGAATTGLTTWTILAGAVCATGLAVVMRGWIVGTWVTDRQVGIDRFWTRTRVPWSDVSSVDVVEDRWPLLGMPITVPGRGVIVVDRDGVRHATHVYATSPDLWLRSEAFDMAALRLQRWAQESGAS